MQQQQRTASSRTSCPLQQQPAGNAAPARKPDNSTCLPQTGCNDRQQLLRDQLQLQKGKLKHESRPATAYSFFSRAATTSHSTSAYQLLPFTLLLISGAVAAFRGSKNGRASNFRQLHTSLTRSTVTSARLQKHPCHQLQDHQQTNSTSAIS
ncbi:hypothetical protein Nepgr_025374 [Nepenthes gracilis]|uniref:Uncharacterized protein n=1 Tax=Nepenthes gracilis TaxID=150966 RepID=A0AAD3T6L6_NEPGR|nr:hypothetical protein Nepgr_025374 [Nepenthes gracilis]